MIDVNLGRVVRRFRREEPDREQQERLFKEVLLMTLARATHADISIQPAEVETVRRIIKEVTGEDVSAADVRVAAVSELYERAPLEKYLRRVSVDLSLSQRLVIARSLADVIRSDMEISGVNSAETRFFDRIVRVLDLTPAELMGLAKSD